MLAVAIVLCSILAAVLVYEFVYYPLWKARIIDVSLSELNSRPRDFDSLRVRLHGYIADTYYKPRYVLLDSNGTNEVFLDWISWKTNYSEYYLDYMLRKRDYSEYYLEIIDLQPYVSYVYDSSREPDLVLEPQLVEIVGLVYYNGLACDVPLFTVNVEKVQRL